MLQRCPGGSAQPRGRVAARPPRLGPGPRERPAAFTDGQAPSQRGLRRVWQGLTPKPHAPFDGVRPTSPNLKRRPGPSVRPGRKEQRRPRTPYAGSSRRRGSACRGTGLSFGSWSSGLCVPDTPALWSSLPAASPRPGIPQCPRPGEVRWGSAPAVQCKRKRRGGRKTVLAKMQLALFLSWCCCLHGCALGTGFLYQFPASTLQHNYPEQSSGSPGSGFASRRHWCHYTVTRTVSCQVQNGSETVIQRVYQSCRWPGPCANLVSYRTLIRPMYKMSYRTVTTLEWRCCPGFTGSNCEE
ncbi:PREDICTED: collagen alpha-1(XXVI) chain, partial [Mesitornis unicolor]|uniref:collagen alpha-1(XXVI) chain n=1 Tax=Mesitornis unicolor TaxID=54374 RepID=UPI000528D811